MKGKRKKRGRIVKTKEKNTTYVYIRVYAFIRGRVKKERKKERKKGKKRSEEVRKKKKGARRSEERREGPSALLIFLASWVPYSAQTHESTTAADVSPPCVLSLSRLFSPFANLFDLVESLLAIGPPSSSSSPFPRVFFFTEKRTRDNYRGVDLV